MNNLLQNIWQKYHTEFLIFSGTFLVRLIVFGALSYYAVTTGTLSSNIEVRQYPVIGSDSGGYIATARHMLAEGEFASPGAGEPQSYQVPIYPLFLAGVMALSGGTTIIILLQILIAGLSSVLVYKLGSIISHTVGIGSALLFMVDPISVFFSTTILTETIFIFFLLLAIYIHMRFFGSLWKGVLLAGIVLGVATLTRPSAIVLPPIFVLTFLLTHTLPTIKQKLIPMVVFSFGFFLVVFPWLLRNKVLFNTWELTAVATIQWYDYNAPLFYAQQHNITHTEAKDIFRSRLFEINPYKNNDGTLQNTPYMRQVVYEFLREDPLGYAGFHIIKTIPFFVSDGLRDIARRMELVGHQPNIGDAVLRFDLPKLQHILFESGRSSLLLITGSGMWVFITLGMIISMLGYRRLNERARRILLISILAVFMTMLIAGGPNSSARYRLSISPFMFIAAAYGLWLFREFLHARFNRTQSLPNVLDKKEREIKRISDKEI
ncbi:MAG: hypothetical protein COU90_01890 [Candidatus Ryanbacteria bacterium CG10_big_fil_rev_8_21_14_0_10_43_42]|uniref:Glycosyltransferase RgtA/B/C/D-like domain-containing protein n=1 Tax=Candidatus Ryanbacteria bacterium CG10_big_fil_rev_8_21_14_0_10_43_42 TaxID=1974864 RepID=A0A2M8KXB3_9BACT|nr:MAG: hypothetical protein COU90_01890 [Candidatus Ryanbacteria bacterium CG10_big_fil_rev_8_21_14_0_10_43_42]